MSTETLTLRPQIIGGINAWLLGIGLLVIFTVTAVIMAFFSYWLAIIFLLIALPILIYATVDEYQARNLWLLLYANLAVMILVASLIFPFLVNNGQVRSLARANDFYNLMLGTVEMTGLSALIIGALAALLFVTIPFLLVVTATAIVLLKWYRSEDVSFGQVWSHTLSSILGLARFLLIVEDKEIKGTKWEKKILDVFGGPGWLMVYSGQAVVLQRHGKLTRAVGRGSVMLRPFEKIKAILPLTPQGGVQDIENVMTRDRISLDLKILHAARVEPAGDTKERLQKAFDEARAEFQSMRRQSPTPEELEKAQQDIRDAEQKLKDLEQDPIIGDDYDQVYESTAKLVGMRAPKDIWAGVQFPIAGNVKDAVMAEHSEDLFKIDSDNGDLVTRIDLRKIKELEDHIKDAAIGSALGKGLKLLTVDFNEVHFPPDLKLALEEEVKARVEERVEETKARTAESKAKAIVIAARAKAQARILEGQGEGEAQAALFREVLRELKREEVLRDDEIADSLLRLITSTTSIKELESFFKATSVRPHERQLVSTVPKNGSHAD